MSEKTYWNGEPTPCRKVRVVVADDVRFPSYWARALVGTQRDAVEVRYGGQIAYLDDEDGGGWEKVTAGRGSPGLGHKNLAAESIEARTPAAGRCGPRGEKVL